MYGTRPLLLDDTERSRTGRSRTACRGIYRLIRAEPAYAEWIRRLRARPVSERLRFLAPNAMLAATGGLVELLIQAVRARSRTRAAAASVASGRFP